MVLLTLVLHTIVSTYVSFYFRKEKPAFGLHKVRADIFDRFFGSLPFRSGSRLHSRVSVGQARRGGCGGGIPLALQILGGGHRIRTCKSLRTPVFKTGALAVLPTLQSHTTLSQPLSQQCSSRTHYTHKP